MLPISAHTESLSGHDSRPRSSLAKDEGEAWPSTPQLSSVQARAQASKKFKKLLALALIVGSALAASSSKDPLCSLPPYSLQQALTQYPTLNTAIQEVLKHSMAMWYTDHQSTDILRNNLASMLSQCSPDSRITLVVYGLPNKDCEAGYSSGGSNQNAADYANWIQTLANQVGQRKVLYVLEPDAVGLVANGGCAVNYGYTDNVRQALSILSQNPNADIYLDVGYWTLLNPTGATSIAKAVKTLATVGRLKGITLNTSNYRPTNQMADLCSIFQSAYGDTSLNCIVDTSRNYNNNPPSTEWCNSRFGGIGRLPTTNTGYPNLDYLIWIKPAGESDGTCDGPGLTADAMKGPPRVSSSATASCRSGTTATLSRSEAWRLCSER